MPYGSLTAITGPMFAGKTNDLVKEILYRSYFSDEERRRCGVFKLRVDARYSETCIVSHDGARVEARLISRSDEIDPTGLAVAFFDEIQFFTPPYFSGDILDTVRDLREKGVDVFCAGLDTDYLGRAFEITAALMAEASEIRRHAALCDVCGAPATRTARIEMTSRRFVPGAGESYRPMCLAHWHEDMRARNDLSRRGDLS